ncbi:peptide deformylase [Vagococcus humatus]|uniref:Peptide deformylase n=1 Tax=Vagococcus humatus TaxID=1889241 RepID=A0A3S0ADH6_9ENTE|nr:peptide deformylase [Vagococcus humatus]RST89282.1 peptide deformylase [Vagococcus humatus]
MLTMKDVIREGHPTLRETAKELTFPLTDEEKQLGEDMLIFLKNSQDPELAEKYELRGGVGLAAPQLNVAKRLIAVHVPSLNPEKEEASLSVVMVNPKIISHSVQDACLKDGEGCLSVDRDVPGYVVRHARATVTYQDLEGNSHKVKLKNYEAIVVQHEIDHLNGIMFYDHINEQNPFGVSSDVLILE